MVPAIYKLVVWLTGVNPVNFNQFYTISHSETFQRRPAPSSGCHVFCIPFSFGKGMPVMQSLCKSSSFVAEGEACEPCSMMQTEIKQHVSLFRLTKIQYLQVEWSCTPSTCFILKRSSWRKNSGASPHAQVPQLIIG